MVLTRVSVACFLQYERVRDVMTSETLYSCQPDDTVDSALEQLVAHRITGLPVLDDTGLVVGVVSDFDLLALDAIGKVNNSSSMFPEAEQTWQVRVAWDGRCRARGPLC